MEHRNRKKDNANSDETRDLDEVDRAELRFPRAAPRKIVNPSFYHDSNSGFERLESPGHDDSAYQTYPLTSTSQSFSKSSSGASSDRFPSAESLRSSSPFSSGPSSSKKTHSTLIRIQLGDDKKVSHEWYSEFTNQSHQHKNALSSPLANRSANSSSQFEYDSHIAQMRGNFKS